MEVATGQKLCSGSREKDWAVQPRSWKSPKKGTCHSLIFVIASTKSSESSSAKMDGKKVAKMKRTATSFGLVGINIKKTNKYILSPQSKCNFSSYNWLMSQEFIHFAFCRFVSWVRAVDVPEERPENQPLLWHAHYLQEEIPLSQPLCNAQVCVSVNFFRCSILICLCSNVCVCYVSALQFVCQSDVLWLMRLFVCLFVWCMWGRLFPSHYKFFPRAFVLPNQLPDLLGCFSTSKLRTYILKPDNGSQVCNIRCFILKVLNQAFTL